MFPLAQRKLIRGCQAHIKAGLGTFPIKSRYSHFLSSLSTECLTFIPRCFSFLKLCFNRVTQAFTAFDALFGIKGFFTSTLSADSFRSFVPRNHSFLVAINGLASFTSEFRRTVVSVNMYPSALYKLKILYTIVLTIFVYVVNNLFPSKKPSYVTFHYQSMLRNISLLPRVGVFRCVDVLIATAQYV